MIPVEYYPEGLPGLDWHAVGDDEDGVVVATSYRGVALARATDRNTVLFLNPDEWADLRDAVKQGHCDHLLGDRTLCADPDPRNPMPPGARRAQPRAAGSSGAGVTKPDS
ncbi:hypothetical protein [Kitasatospora phosalacinea]|uniref:hypothetical protein n=1 Tax=Kitasatospora phosalacinea TaxID=2065 RepID=UPI000526D8F7|nr:hypothetical protein [Kitasatospora phosalacinea]